MSFKRAMKAELLGVCPDSEEADPGHLLFLDRPPALLCLNRVRGEVKNGAEAFVSGRDRAGNTLLHWTVQRCTGKLG